MPDGTSSAPGPNLGGKAYKVVDPTGPHLPSRLYHEKIVRGALARGLPAGWIAWLRGLSIKG